MKFDINLYLTDKRKALAPLLGLVVIVLLIAGGLTGAKRYALVKKKAAVMKEEYSEFSALKKEFLQKKKAMDSVARKAYVSAGGLSTIALVEEAGDMAGIKERITELKTLGEKTEMGYRVRDAEVKIEKVELNQLVNLLYLIENHRTLLVIKEFSVKSSFEEPNLLDVTLKLSHLITGDRTQ